MSFHEIQFPTNISYGSRGGPGFSTGVVEVDSGAEERTARWSFPRHSYDVSYGIRTHDDLYAVKLFFIGRQGSTFGFRFKDFSDFASTANGRLDLAIVTEDDQTIGTGDGVTTLFQLKKNYTSGPVTRVRNITKPVTGTTKIGFNGTNQTSGFTVNTTTGIVTFTTAPTLGVMITAGFEFDVPVRFGLEVDRVLSVVYDTFDSSAIESIPLIELFGEEEIEDEFFYGGAQNHGSIGSNVSITVSGGRVQAFTPTTGGLKIFLPDPTDLPDGGIYFILANESGTNTLLVRTEEDSAVITLGTNSVVECFVGRDGSNLKVWLAK